MQQRLQAENGADQGPQHDAGDAAHDRQQWNGPSGVGAEREADAAGDEGHETGHERGEAEGRVDEQVAEEGQHEGDEGPELGSADDRGHDAGAEEDVGAHAVDAQAAQQRLVDAEQDADDQRGAEPVRLGVHGPLTPPPGLAGLDTTGGTVVAGLVTPLVGAGAGAGTGALCAVQISTST